jgi:hypothetical protein
MTTYDRRTLLKRSGIGIAGLLAAGGLLAPSSEPALAASELTASDVTVSTNDDELNSRTISPDITVSWSGREKAVETVEVTWCVMTSSTSETTDVTLSMDATIKDSGDNILESRTDILGPTSFAVTVNNISSSVSSSGTANTSVS